LAYKPIGASPLARRSAGRAFVSQVGSAPSRTDGYAPIEDYAAVGDGRTVALVARDGSIDWLCLPDLDSPSVFAAILDADRGGSFRLAPGIPFEVERRYLPDTNVLQTSFHTGRGSVRVTDAMTLPLGGLAPARELARNVEGLAGEVPMSWSVEPRFGYGGDGTRIERRGGVPVASRGANAVALCSWSAGEPRPEGGSVGAEFTIGSGERAMFALSAAHGDPLVLPSRQEVEARLRMTTEYWRAWARDRRYQGPWRDAVIRSALALKLLIFAPSGAIAAAATSSLPEAIGGERNWDYRYSWIRDASGTLDALFGLGCPQEADAFFWWLMHASQLTHPRLRVLYRLSGGTSGDEAELAMAGYRDSRPVRVGNGAAEQTQLDVYGHLLQTSYMYASARGEISADIGRRLARTADLVCETWRRPDSGIWEVRSEPRHFTQSKMMCWIALERALRLAAQGVIPANDARRWGREADELRRFVAERCWSEERGAYVRSAGSEDLDASVLLAAILGYAAGEEDERLVSTIDRILSELGEGPLLYRYKGDDGLAGSEGAFTTCSFWLVDALARLGERDRAAELMEELLARANDVGLYAEEIEPSNGRFLGNFPQGLVHLALINAASTLSGGRAR
jgi:GH15 family glucan-1,4-alpha-glucosidase